MVSTALVFLKDTENKQNKNSQKCVNFTAGHEMTLPAQQKTTDK